MSKSKFYCFLNRLCSLFRIEVSIFLFGRRIATFSIPPDKKRAVVSQDDLINELTDIVKSCESPQPSTPPGDEL